MENQSFQAEKVVQFENMLDCLQLHIADKNYGAAINLWNNIIKFGQKNNIADYFDQNIDENLLERYKYFFDIMPSVELQYKTSQQNQILNQTINNLRSQK